MPEELAAAVRTQIARLMTAHRISGNALAKATGIPQRTLARKLDGGAQFGLDEVAAIAAHFGAPPEDLIAWARRGAAPNE